MIDIIKIAFDKLEEGIREEVFPGAVACVGNRDGIIYSRNCGYRQLYPFKEEMELDTLFDIASLTKVTATLPLIMIFLQKGNLSLYDAVGDYLKPFENEKDLRIKHLLTHTSGFEPYSRMDQKGIKPEDVVSYIAGTKRMFPIGREVVYSDYNFILLKYILEKVIQESFDEACRKYVFHPLGMNNTVFNPQQSDNIAATEFCEKRKKFLKGVVHDENARYLGGISGHAGLFSSIEDLSKYCEMYLNNGRTSSGDLFFSSTTVNAIIHNYTNGLQENRGLGFSIRGLENSSGGELFSEEAFGHTGFTGTSIWIDRARGIYIILLTNRVHPTRENMEIIKFRRHFHNAVNYAVDQCFSYKSLQKDSRRLE